MYDSNPLKIKKYLKKETLSAIKVNSPTAGVSGPFWWRLTHFIFIILHSFPFL